MSFSVRFLYIDPDGDRNFVANVLALPRPGDLLMPERGMMAIVDHVMHFTHRKHDDSLLMIPRHSSSAYR